MIVCSCNAFSDRDVQSTIAGAAQRPRMSQVYASLGCSAKCGRCTPTVKRIMDEAWASFLEPAAERAACSSRMKANAFGRADAVHECPSVRLVGCLSQWRQATPGESPISSPAWNCSHANSDRGKPDRPGARAGRPPLAKRETIGTPLHERGECVDEAA
jgi:bacterioferritin-associated ferredoxin